jgi:hypothetical protein
MGTSPSKHGKGERGGSNSSNGGVVVVSSPTSSAPSSPQAVGESFDHHHHQQQQRDFARPLLSQRGAAAASLSAQTVLVLVAPLLEAQGARAVAIGATQSALVQRASQAQLRAAALLPTASANVDDTRRYARRIAVLADTVDEILRRTNDDLASVSRRRRFVFFVFLLTPVVVTHTAGFNHQTLCQVARRICRRIHITGAGGPSFGELVDDTTGDV